jgi:hypothetical protein
MVDMLSVLGVSMPSVAIPSCFDVCERHMAVSVGMAELLIPKRHIIMLK